MVTVSAPGKIHLMGEHAVVYGRPAVLAAINRRTTVSVRPDKRGIHIVSGESSECIQKIVTLVCRHLSVSRTPDITISVTSDIPVGYHLGSSAAVAVATAGALLYFLKKSWNPTIVNRLAFQAEKIHHGNPSGGDNTASTFGGFLWFCKEQSSLNGMRQLPFHLDPGLSRFFLINTGKPKETTCEMVTYVRQRFTVHGSRYKKLFDQNEEQTQKIAVALKEGDEVNLIDAIRKGEKTLEGMGVVSEKVMPLMRKIEKLGGAVKILGGGGRTEGTGFLLCYHHNQECIRKICDEYHCAIENVRLGEEGVRLDEK